MKIDPLEIYLHFPVSLTNVICVLINLKSKIAFSTLILPVSHFNQFYCLYEIWVLMSDDDDACILASSCMHAWMTE